MRGHLYRITPFLIFVGLGLFLYKGLSLNPRDLPSNFINKSLPQFEVTNLLDTHSKFTSDLFKNKVSLLNVFASWCDACLSEHVELMKIHDEGISIYGINYKDNAEAAKLYLKRYGNPYAAVGADFNGRLAIDLGVYGAPETFVIDQKGRVRFRLAGILTPDIYQQKIKPLLLKLDTKDEKSN